MDRTLDHRIRVAAVRREEMKLHLLFSGLVLASVTSIQELEVEDVVRHAKVSRGSFYNYFPSLRDFYDELLKTLMSEFKKATDSLEAQSPDVAIRLASAIRILMRFAVDFPMIGKLLTQIQWPGREAELDTFQNIFFNVESGIKEGRFTSMPESIGINIVIGSVIGGIHAMLLNHPAACYEDKVANQVLLGLGVDKISADKVSKMPLPPYPEFQVGGIFRKILEIDMKKENRI